jgi:aspartyl-tRNA(Asn)/glutamyl-tRNA(Gln) amidotransferase subunit A
VTLWAEAERLAREIGAEIVEVSIPSARYSLPAYYIIALSEASSNLARYDGVKYGYRAPKFENLVDMYEQTRAQGFGAQVKRRIMLGTFTLSAGYYDAYYLKAQKVRAKIAAEFAAAFAAVDFLFMPTAPTAAFAIGSHNADPVQMFLEDIFTVPINLAGLPALSLPVARDARGMPLGLQIVGPQFSDERLLRAAADVEKAAAFTL